MRITPIINRIREQCPLYVAVNFPDSLLPIDEIADIPAAFVFWVEEKSRTRDVVVTAQKRTYTFQVMTVGPMPNLELDTDLLDDARNQLTAALLGFSLPGFEPITHADAVVEEIKGGKVQVKDFFEITKQFRSTN